MQATDDGALLRQYAENDSQDAFAALVARHVNLVYSVAFRHIGDRHHAEEITQAVFVILARKAGQLRHGQALSSWLFQATRLTANNFIRSEIRRRRREQEAHMQSAPNESSDDIWQRIAPLLDAAVADLAESDRRAIILRFYEGRNLREVGTALGATEEAARKRVNRAVEKLRRFFSKRKVMVPTADLTSAISANSVQAAPAVLAKSVVAVGLAKGAAASASTLTLINGALKVMAWTKAKTAVVACSIVILTAGSGVVLIEAIQSARVSSHPDIQGAWEGTMHFDTDGIEAGQASSSRMVLKLTRTNGGYRATGDWIDKGRKDVPLGHAIYHYPTLEIQRNLRDTWKFTLNKDATEMVLDHTIHFIQPDPVTLTRTTTPDPAPEPLADGEFEPRSNSDLQGYWKGTIGNGSDALPVDLKIAEQPDGTFRAEGDDPMQGALGQPVSVTYNRPTVKLMLASGAGVFQGQINMANSEISGTYIQAGQPIPAKLARADYKAEHARDGLKDYSFSSPDDLQGHWKGTWICPIGKFMEPFRFTLDIAKMPDATFLAELANVDQFGNDAPIPASDFKFSPPNLRMKWKWGNTAYEGKLEKGKLVGTWFQSGGGFPLVFERVE